MVFSRIFISSLCDIIRSSRSTLVRRNAVRFAKGRLQGAPRTKRASTQSELRASFERVWHSPLDTVHTTLGSLICPKLGSKAPYLNHI